MITEGEVARGRGGVGRGGGSVPLRCALFRMMVVHQVLSTPVA
jgi:hypothetical protein